MVFCPTSTGVLAKAGTLVRGDIVVHVGRLRRFDACGMCGTMDLNTLHKFQADSILYEPPELTGDEVMAPRWHQGTIATTAFLQNIYNK